MPGDAGLSDAETPVEPHPPRKRYAGFAVAAIITAFVALFFEGRIPPLNIAAAVLALIGLRQIRRDPLRYKGRAFCWLAVALAIIVATLAALVEPSLAT
ncbi:hypothetical protein SAMN05192555_11837 [Franzmannia pantelleriensis]|uniref:Uncharacterized protein n=1 Tax=Franzmannia pantelleriensis TaxID=48727 RepID=A0A1G9VLE1_9GAMM|nr:hypothetical protein [Halomonas pantelleriensis]SDM72883.1 hypothetical protein SAMN05192555_11837 [Halomonas pantelleriensis]